MGGCPPGSGVDAGLWALSPSWGHPQAPAAWPGQLLFLLSSPTSPPNTAAASCPPARAARCHSPWAGAAHFIST